MIRVGFRQALVFMCLALAGCTPVLGLKPDGAALGAKAEVGSGVVGNTIGRDLDAGDRRAAKEAEYRALEYGKTGTPIAWKNAGNRGEVVPGPSYRVNTYDCRDVTHTIYVGSQTQSARGTACRLPSGAWQPVS
jgi:surface antigen